jgi:thiamine-monophosphate kinase
MTGFTEDELVQAVRTILGGAAPGVLLGPGDDAALVEPGAHVGVLTADLLIEGVHFERASIAARDLGHKSLTVNVSDVAAMGGSPRYGLVSLGVPPDVELSWLVELFGGIRDAAQDYGMSVVGGDTSRAECIVVSVAVTGEVAAAGAVTRAGARPGDRVVVTGALGAAAGGVRLAREGDRAALTSDWGRALIAAADRPSARVGEGQTLAGAGASAMIDISDGLARDLGRVCAESHVGAAVRLADVPVAEALRPFGAAFGVEPLQLALGGGEDYELLACLPPERVEDARAALRERFDTALTDVGAVRASPGMVAVAADGSERPLEPSGWDHFAA